MNKKHVTNMKTRGKRVHIHESYRALHKAKLFSWVHEREREQQKKIQCINRKRLYIVYTKEWREAESIQQRIKKINQKNLSQCCKMRLNKPWICSSAHKNIPEFDTNSSSHFVSFLFFFQLFCCYRSCVLLSSCLLFLFRSLCIFPAFFLFFIWIKKKVQYPKRHNHIASNCHTKCNPFLPL